MISMRPNVPRHIAFRRRLVLRAPAQRTACLRAWPCSSSDEGDPHGRKRRAPGMLRRHSLVPYAEDERCGPLQVGGFGLRVKSCFRDCCAHCIFSAIIVCMECMSHAERAMLGNPGWLWGRGLLDLQRATCTKLQPGCLATRHAMHRACRKAIMRRCVPDGLQRALPARQASQIHGRRDRCEGRATVRLLMHKVLIPS